MTRFVDSILMFLMVLAICVVAFSVLFGLGWLWGLGLMWTAGFGWFAPIAYLTATICILPAIAITHSIMEDR